jgi:hypothetical protein
MMTGNMLSALEAGEFHDPAWVTRLLGSFSGLYFDALDKHEQSPLMTPHVWRVAFEVAANPEAFAVQHLLLGVNAHINYDLGAALVAVLRTSIGCRRRETEALRDPPATRSSDTSTMPELVIARYALTDGCAIRLGFDDLMVSG